MVYPLLLAGLLVFVSAGSVAAPRYPAPAVWIAPCERKVFRDDAVPASATARLGLAAARNAGDAAQVVLRPDRDVSLISASVSDLAGPAGAAIPAASMRLYVVAYIHLPAHGKGFPDPLPPLKLPLELKAGRNQPVWIDVRVPDNATPGRFRGEVAFAFSDGSNARVPIDLTVWRFAIPTKPAMRTAFGIIDDYVALQHDVPAGSLKHRKLMDAYYEMLVSRRISPYSVPSGLFSPSAARYLDDPRVTSFTIPYSDDQAALRRTVDYVRAKGWLPKGYFYVVDEPVNREQFDRLKQVCERIHRVDPTLKIVAPFFRDPDFAPGKTVYDLLPGIINIWCTSTGYLKPDAIRARQRLGEEAWWYVCCGPGKPYANFFVDMDGLAHRILFWQQMKYGVQGLLYWSTTWWNPSSTKDPWTDIATVKDINATIYGDGSLLYPGARVDIDGPVTSIRLELARAGMEDYELLTLYARAFGADTMQRLVARVVTSMTAFETDPARFEAVRRDMAADLEHGRVRQVEPPDLGRVGVQGSKGAPNHGRSAR